MKAFDFTIVEKTRARIPTEYGEFHLVYFENSKDSKEHLAFVYGELDGETPILTRLHSECITAEVFGSLRCDCGSQLKQAMQQIVTAGVGVIVYLRQEGRGIGLLNKLRAYRLQDLKHLNTLDANLELGCGADERTYDVAAAILNSLGINQVILMTNNQEKIDSLQENGIEVIGLRSMPASVNDHNRQYLETKVQLMNHSTSLLGEL